MKDGFNEWDYLPHNLEPKEIDDPLLVISDFFAADSLDGHLERLKKWRDAIINDDFFKDERGSPAGLLFFHKLNIRLIEAVSLLLKDSLAEKKENALQAATINERLDIYAVISAFFSDYNLPEYRKQLSDWLDFGLSKTNSSGFVEAKELIHIYENLNLLYHTAWKIYELLEDPAYEFDTDTIILGSTDQDVTLYQLNSQITEPLAETIKKVVTVIKEKADTTQVIFYLGSIPGTDKLYFLVLTADEEQRQSLQLGSMIEDCCKVFSTINAQVYRMATFRGGIRHQEHYFKNALNAEVVYLSGQMPVSLLNAQVCDNFIKNDFRWDRWYKQAQQFLYGAEFYLNHKLYNAALFSIQQCAECVLVATIKGVLDYRIGSHNLVRLIDLTKMFTNDLAAVFESHNDEKRKQFEVLKNAYINVRYKDNFAIDPEMICAINLDVTRLFVTAEKVYKKHLLLNSL